MSQFNLLKLCEVVDSRGKLSVIQDELPFNVQRVFWIVDADEQIRGGHRHHMTRQALIALRGTVLVYMNDGTKAETVRLDSPSLCLIVEPEDWHTMRFESGSILLVLASEKYDRKDYIDAPY